MDGLVYMVVVRVRDVVGNFGLLGLFSMISSSEFVLCYVVIIVNDFMGWFIYIYVSIGDINNDGFEDVVMGGDMFNGACIIYGYDIDTI